ncbi:DNA primase [Flavobacterium columnare]|uniref:DNA primase n=1 Tax=Flavobacterium columnare TaxID=996 RepID=UPI004034E8D7
MRYTESSIDDVRNVDIDKIVSRYCELKGSGYLLTGKSPFNVNDRTPSFTVNKTKNNFVCYSTQKKGDGLKFIMEIENCSFHEAVEKIADIGGVILQKEAVSDEVMKKETEKESLLQITQWASTKFQEAYNKLSQEHWAKVMVKERGFTDETLLLFDIGYAPDEWQYLTNPTIAMAKYEPAKTAGLIAVSNEKSYDFFRNRLVFPIHDVRGKIIGYTARISNTGTDAKYVNSPQTPLYNKSKSVYGIYQAKGAMAKTKTVIITEGPTDVIALHQANCANAVATGGTALTPDQCKLMARFASTAILCRDNDGFDKDGNPKAGTVATLKDINMLLSHGFRTKILVLPENEDPDSWSRKCDDFPKYVSENTKDAVIWKTQYLFNFSGSDPYKKDEAVSQVAEMLFEINSDLITADYIKDCAAIFGIKQNVLKGKIEILATKAIEKAKNEPTKTTAEDLGLPEGADLAEFMKHRYVTVGNSCWFQGRGANFFKGTNYRLTPLFHVYGKGDNKRLCEVINEDGHKKLIDFDSADFVSRNNYDVALLNEGYYVNMENFGSKEFTIMRNRIMSDFIMAYELKTLGYQKEGFFAFANKIYNNGKLLDVNKYGIVQVDTKENKEDSSEYNKSVNHYYSPSCSEIYKHSREDDDPYENDRYFVYKQSPVTLKSWMKQLKIVYGKKAHTGIAFIIASMFRDIYVKRYQFFPHLFLSGEKGSGKSKFGESLVALFTYKQEPFDLNSGTPVAFYRRLSRIMNAPTMLEEFHDNVDDKIFQSLKGAYDGRGREMGKATSDNRTTTTKVNSSLIILSQYLSSRDDNSLTSRSIIEHFVKQIEAFTNEQLENYSKLKEWEEEGLSSMLIEILQHREFVEKHLHEAFASINKKIKEQLKGKEYQERMLQNYVCLLAPLKLLQNKIEFPFSYDEIENQFLEAIIDSSDLIVESEGLAEFWRTLEYLLDRKPFSLLIKGSHFMIDEPISISLQTRKGEADRKWDNTDKKRVLFLRLNAVHPLYHKEISTRDGMEVITENTLRNYFKSKKYFIGAVSKHQFKDARTSAYVFDYDMMENSGILNLIRQEKAEGFTGDKDEDDDLPY